MMRMAMNIEQRGSTIIQPNKCIKTADTMTPTLPKVSANICKNTPAGKTNFIPKLNNVITALLNSKVM